MKKKAPGILLFLAFLIPVGIFYNVVRDRVNSRKGFNVIVIMVDTLRADHLGCYGYKKNTSPFMDRLAQKSVVFEHAISQGGWTKPSVASFFTSLYPHNHHTVSEGGSSLPLEITTLAEKLGENGYFTMGFQTNPSITKKRNFHQGFDVYEDLIMNRAEVVLARFLSEWDTKKPQKFFAYIHLMDTHVPYRPREKYRREFAIPYVGKLDKFMIGSREEIIKVIKNLNREDKEHVAALYDACVKYVDGQLQILFGELTRRALLEKTVVVILSDHGEELFEHGGFEHGHTLYNEIMRIPLVVWHPRLHGENRRVRQPVRMIDIFPTLLSFLGIERPRVLMGEDLYPMIMDPKLDLNLAAFSEGMYHGGAERLKAIQTSSYKLIKDTVTSTIEFYDLSADPMEKNSLAEHPLVKQYEKLLDEYVHAGRHLAYPPTVNKIDDETRRQLRSLGYLN